MAVVFILFFNNRNNDYKEGSNDDINDIREEFMNADYKTAKEKWKMSAVDFINLRYKLKFKHDDDETNKFLLQKTSNGTYNEI